MSRSRLIVALDTADRARASSWAGSLADACGMFKLGLEYVLANGPEGVRAIGGRPLFLDLKLHDIPNTVAGATRALAALSPAMLTVHAGGGGAMVAAARAALGEGTGRPRLLAVTVLTSLDAASLRALGAGDDPSAQVLRLAGIALDAGADGLVCSPHEIVALRARFGAGPLLVVPGIRPAGAERGDQARVTTPGAALAAGADWLVVGRPITAAPDPAAAAASIASEMCAAAP